MSEPLLSIPNHHFAGCGDPPMITGGHPDIYIGYFENRFGEQWIFAFHRKTRKGELRGGDTGWNTVHTVISGTVHDLILGRDEALWLKACWAAAAGGG